MPSSDSAGTPRRVVDLLLDALIVLCALAGAALGRSGSVWAAVWTGLSLLLLVGQLAQSRLDRGEAWSPLGRALVLRSSAAVAVGALYAGRVAGSLDTLGAWLGVSVLVAAVVSEPFIARAVRFTIPVAVRLPGLKDIAPTRDLGIPAVLASVGACVLGLLFALARLSAWFWLPLALLAVVPVGLMAVQGRRKILLARTRRAQVHRAVAKFAPDFIVYTSRPDDASYQVLMWLPYLQRSGLKLMIVARNAVPAAVLAAKTDVPVVEARGMGDLDALVVPSLKAAFYVNASSGNGAFVRFQHLTHIYLGHGDSDKPPSYNPTHAMYDEVWAAGPAAARRYAAHGVRIPAEKFRIVGRPQVESVRPVERAMAAQESPVVLYAPTWRGHVEETMLYSLPVGEQIVAALLNRNATVIFRPHPFSYDFAPDATTIGRIQALLEADAKKTGRAHAWGAAAETDRSILDCINDSDAMVTDVSSVVSDYLFSGKPFAMIAVPAEPAAFVAEFPVARASYVVRDDLADLDGQLDAMLGTDPLAGERAAIRVDYLGDFPAEGYAATFVDAVGHVTGKTLEDMDSDDKSGTDDQAAEETGADEGAEDGREANGEDGAPAEEARNRNWSRYRQLASRVGLDLLGTGLALLSLGAALLPLPDWLVVVLGLAALWAAFGSVPQVIRNWRRWASLLTEGDATRAVLLLVLMIFAERTGEWSWAYLVTCSLIMVMIVEERRIRSFWGQSGLTVRHLPAALPRIRQLVARGTFPLAGSLLLAAGLILVLVGAPSVILLVATVLVFAFFLETLARAVWRAATVIRAEAKLRPALEAYAPEFAVYFASTVGASYQIGMWLPYFRRIGRPFIFITRTMPMLRQIETLCEQAGVEIPILYRPTLRSVEEAIVGSMTSAFYVNNAVRNTHFIERRDLTHVWLNHGDSEKPACFNPVHAIYDLLFVAGRAGIDRYARHGVTIPEEKFRIVGRPQVELVQPARGAIGTLADRTVLYAPTWQGPFADTRVYSLPAGARIVSALMDRGARVIFRAHPFNYRYPEAVEMITEIGALLDADRAVTGREHMWGPAAEQAMTIEDCFNASDAMISDVSAVVSDYLHADKPFAIVSVGRTPEQLLHDVPAARAAYVLADDLGNLDRVCTDLLGTDPMAGVRQETKIYYLGDFPDADYADGFLTAARKVIDRLDP